MQKYPLLYHHSKPKNKKINITTVEKIWLGKIMYGPNAHDKFYVYSEEAYTLLVRFDYSRQQTT